MKDKDLKPCPFCGGEAEIKLYGKGPWMVTCSNKGQCGALMSAFSMKHTDEEIMQEIHDKVIIQWNRREGEAE